MSTKKTQFPDLRNILSDSVTLISNYASLKNPMTGEGNIATIVAMLANRKEGVSGEGEVIGIGDVRIPYALKGYSPSRIGNGYHGEEVTVIRSDQHPKSHLRYMGELSLRPADDPETFLETSHLLGFLITTILTGNQSNPSKNRMAYTNTALSRILLTLMENHGFSFDNVSVNNSHYEKEKDYSPIVINFPARGDDWLGYLRVLSAGIPSDDKLERASSKTPRFTRKIEDTEKLKTQVILK